MKNKKKKAVLTIDLENDHAGYVSEEKYDAWEVKRVKRLIKALRKRNIPLNAFITGRTLEKNPQSLKLFEDYKTSFYLHSYSHKLDKADTKEEIIKGIKSFKKHFGKKPKGYRSPGGMITKKGIKTLEKEGFVFDSSTIISFWPKPTFLLLPRKPFFWKKGGLIEIPFSALTPFGIPLSLSYAKLLGINIFKYLLKRSSPPEVVVFNIHLHDLCVVPSYKKLSPFWKFIYSRNRNEGFTYFEIILDLMAIKGYRFTTLEKVVKEVETT